jgi:serine protease AprX
MSRFRGIRWTAALVASVAFLILGAPVSGQSSGPVPNKLDVVVRDAVANGRTVRAIVRFRTDSGGQRGARSIAARGGQVRRVLNGRALNVVVDASTVAALAKDADVAGISIDAEVRASTMDSGSAGRRFGPAPAARKPAGGAGRGVSIAVIDSGVRPHRDLPASRIRAFVDFVNGGTVPYDDYGHGTHVAGILAGSGAASAGLNDGVVPDVDVVALKVLDAQGSGKTSDVIAALDWVAANHLRYNIRVVNLSLGHPVFESASTDPLVQAAEALVRRGIVVVASAGNRGLDPRDNDIGYGGISSPANGPSVIAVGAVDTKGTAVRSDDRVTDYSSRGPTRFDHIVKPDLVAPGHDVVSLSAPGSALFDAYPGMQVTGGDEGIANYMRLSGTSMAAPEVAGTAALMLRANPKLSAGAVRAVLEFTAQRLADTDIMSQGAGYLNTAGAVRLADLLKVQTDVGSVWLRRQDGVPIAADALFGEPVAWGKVLIWGDRALLGDFAYVHMAGFDDNIVWGEDDNIVWGDDNIVWGDDNIVWGEDNIVWGEDNIVWGELFNTVVWGQCETTACDNIVWGADDNIVWGEDNIVWGEDNIVWGEDNIVWGEDNIVWGEGLWPLMAGGR